MQGPCGELRGNRDGKPQSEAAVCAGRQGSREEKERALEDTVWEEGPRRRAMEMRKRERERESREEGTRNRVEATP